VASATINQLVPENERIAVVLLGSFNPRIHHPGWRVKVSLASEEDFVVSTHPSKEQEPIVTPGFSRCSIGNGAQGGDFPNPKSII